MTEAGQEVDRTTNPGYGRLWLLLGLVLVLTVVGGIALQYVLKPAVSASPSVDSADEAPLPADHPVVIRKPSGELGIDTGVKDDKGNPVLIACATCHTSKPPNPEAKIGVPLTLFHQSLIGKHGELTCISCHNPSDGYKTLRLADGKAVPYSEVMQLCAQCHGQQFNDYKHGAHGGMSGYWDLSKGGRQRNNCIDCHDSHSPKFPTVIPVSGPNDRFQKEDKHE
jgi:hypothetical protein